MAIRKSEKKKTKIRKKKKKRMEKKSVEGPKEIKKKMLVGIDIIAFFLLD